MKLQIHYQRNINAIVTRSEHFRDKLAKWSFRKILNWENIKTSCATRHVHESNV